LFINDTEACDVIIRVHDGAVIEVFGLCKSFPAKRGRRGELVSVVNDVDLLCTPGRVTCLLGPNGSGKTTLLRMLCGLLGATSGTISVAGFEIPSGLSDVQRRTGFVTGSTKLYGKLTGREVLGYFTSLYGMSSVDATARMAKLIDDLDLGEFIDKRVDAMSMGMVQRISVARALVHDPKVIILDEPTAGLDVLASRALLQVMVDLRDAGKTVLCSTHLMGEVNLIADDVVVIHHGEVKFSGSLAEWGDRAGGESLEKAFLDLLLESEVGA